MNCPVAGISAEKYKLYLWIRDVLLDVNLPELCNEAELVKGKRQSGQRQTMICLGEEI